MEQILSSTWDFNTLVYEKHFAQKLKGRKIEFYDTLYDDGSCADLFLSCAKYIVYQNELGVICFESFSIHILDRIRRITNIVIVGY